ncbi:Arachidonate 5-lipoxygenase-activating protein [Chelonia mydas]|uniref:Arachidonate 5-lipoxygenase-activating protein n=1 Tax=Chelonia mydas TaxID=8469 RepID=M7AZY8_CHEMY|nr:Arachidonate 5-lipoxygenase-activating protein [Chelonia mydas]
MSLPPAPNSLPYCHLKSIPVPEGKGVTGIRGYGVHSDKPAAKMDHEVLGSIVLLAIVSLISVLQNAFFATKVEHESKNYNGKSFQRVGSSAFDRVFTANTPGYIFGKRIISFLFFMSVAGILNYYLVLIFGSDFEVYIKTVTNTISPLLLIP